MITTSFLHYSAGFIYILHLWVKSHELEMLFSSEYHNLEENSFTDLSVLIS